MRVFTGVMAIVTVMGTVFVYGACAGGDDPQAAATGPEPDSGGPTQLGDVDASPLADGAAPKDAADAEPPLFCSDAGWCETRFPDDTRSLIGDIWPVDGTAFAARKGVEQFDGTAWVSLYDDTVFRSIWAPSANEVWAGDDSGAVAHGKRSGGTWTWTTEQVGDPGYNPVVSIWGSSADDVYAATASKLYHRVASTDGGGSKWVADYVDEHPLGGNTLDFAITQVTGTGPNDVWLLASRILRCSILAHKTEQQFTTVADCKTTCNPDFGCTAAPVPPAMFMDWGYTNSGFALQSRALLTLSPSTYASLPPSLQKLSLSADGGPSVARFAAPGAAGSFLWGLSETDLYSVGYGVVTHSSDAFTDGGKFSISTVVLNGAPIIEQLNIRGTDAKNLWVFGGAYALHKSAL